MPIIKTYSSTKVLTVTVSRPEALNALNVEILDGLRDSIQETFQSHEVSGLIITGAGDKAFVAGADIQGLSGLTPTEALNLAQKGQNLFSMIENCPKPVIAAINGFALGGGCELAMACHLRIGVESAKLGQPEVNLGIIPGYGGTQRLTQLVGRGKALELMLTGDMISAQEAKLLGLLNHVTTTQAELMELAHKIINKIIAKGPIAVANTIKSINAGFGFEKEGYKTEAESFAACAGTQDFKEGTAAFLEKRKPVFKGV